MKIYIYLEPTKTNTEDCISTMHGMHSDPFSVGDIVHINVKSTKLHTDLVEHPIMAKSHESMVKKYHRTKVMLTSVEKFLRTSVIDDDVLTVEYMAVFVDD